MLEGLVIALVLIVNLFILTESCYSGYTPGRKNHHDTSDFFVPTDGYNLPLLGKDFQMPKTEDLLLNITAWNKSIPRLVWVAVRNTSDARPVHTAIFMKKNMDWSFNICGNDEKDYFMYKHFNNTSILWAYHILNPLLGTAKVEVWRLAVLYVYGGLYIDDDADIGTPLDSIVREGDKLILGKESYDYDDRCFIDEFPLSNKSLYQKYGVDQYRTDIFDNKYFFNWAIFSSPKHPIVLKILEYAVELIKREYLGNSAIKMHVNDHRGKLLMCATTFPITLVARDFFLKNESTGLRIGGFFFHEYGGNMKAWYNDHAPNHWVKMINKKRTPYLREYAPLDTNYYENKLVQAPNQKEVYLVINKSRHAFPDLDTFLSMHFDLNQIKLISNQVMKSIPKGDDLPKKELSI